MRASFVQGTVNPAVQGGGSSTTLKQGTAFQITVPALVSKSRATTPVIRDTQTNGAGTVDPQWGRGFPNDFTGALIGNNMQIRPLGYDPFSQGIGTPNPFVGGVYAGITSGATPSGNIDNFEQFLEWQLQLPNTIQTGDTCCIYLKWRERNEPTTNLGLSAAHGSGYNNKIFAYGGPGGYQGSTWLTALPNSGNGAAISQITWAANVATVTTTANIPFISVGETFSTQITGASPAGFNTSGMIPNATVTAANQFTYSLTTNPGGTSTTGTYLTPAITKEIPDCQLHNGDNAGSITIIELPDRNGVNSIFWHHRLNSYNPANGWLQIEVEICVDTHTGATGKGFYNYIVNGNRTGIGPTGTIISYAGRTDNFMTIDPINRAIDIGCGMYNQAANDPHTIAYLSDIYMDISAGAVSGQCARLVLGDQPTYNACAIIEPQVINSMSQVGGQTIVSGNSFWQGSLALGTAYAYWVAETGAIISAGSATITSIIFDFFISPTGSDTNPGTLAQPWAITSLSNVSRNANNIANWNTSAGKKIGLVAGYYDVSGLMAVGTGGQEMIGAIDPQGGTSASAPTYIASCDVNGNYSARAAWIDGKGATNLFAGHHQTVATGSPPIIAHGQSGNVGFLTIDGIRLSGFSYKGIRLGGKASGDGNTITNPILITNCEFFSGGWNQVGMIMTLGTITGGSGYTNGTYNIVPITGGSGTAGTAWFGSVTVSGGSVTAVSLTGGVGGQSYAVGDTISCAASSIGGTGSGFSVPVTSVITAAQGADGEDNGAALWIDANTNAVTATNNWFHDTNGHVYNSGDHLSAIIVWGGGQTCTGTVITNNTCVRAGNIFGKEGGIGGTTVANNYLDISNQTIAVIGIQDFTGNSDGTAASTLTTNINNNVVIASGSNTSGSWDMLGGVSTDSINTLAWRSPVNINNNTVVNVSSTAGVVFLELTCNAGEHGVGAVKAWNNILWNKGGGTGTLSGNGNVRANPQSLAVLDYNLYPTSGVTWAIASNSAPATTSSTATTAAAFATAYATAGGISGTEAHSLAGTPAFVLSGLYAAQYRLSGGSPGQGAGSSNGTTGGTATDMGAWGNGATQVGCTFAT